jgi:predicted amidohydrolase
VNGRLQRVERVERAGILRPSSLRLGVVQLALEDELAANLAKIVGFIHQAGGEGCRAVVFPEGALHSPPETPTGQIDGAVDAICAAARAADIYVVTGLLYKRDDGAPQNQRLLAIGPDGRLIQVYDKIWGDPLANDVPGTFEIDGIVCGAAICADRWARGIEELPAFAGAQVLIECSCNWLREWVADLDHFWCAPRARRTGAYVVFSNGTQAWGGRPGHGHTAVIAPDGSTVMTAGDDPDRLLVATLDLSLATGAAAAERRDHPLFRRFWETGVTLMNRGPVDVPAEALEHAPLVSPEARLKVAAAQMACSRVLDENVARAAALIRAAAAERAEVVVFPELALTGALAEDILAADEAALVTALASIQNAARASGVHVAIGLPWIENGRRLNSAAIIGPDGTLLTRYDQLVVDRPELFTPGTSTRAMWFQITPPRNTAFRSTRLPFPSGTRPGVRSVTTEGVPAVVTLGRDALWSELAELAAVRGAQVHLHLAYDRDVAAGASLRRKQLWVNLANFRTLTVTVNAASPERLPCPSAPAQGGSIIWEDFRREPHATARRTGAGPWSAYRLAEAAEGEALFYATQTVLPVNAHFGHMTDTRNPQMRPWYALGAHAIFADASGTTGTADAAGTAGIADTAGAAPTPTPILAGAAS